MFALKYLVLTYFTLLITTTFVTSWMDPFPAAKFFNISEDEIDKVSKFLCQVNIYEEKSCSCDKGYINENWCVDIVWKIGFHHDLDLYFEIFKMFLINHGNYDYALSCQPIISVPNSQTSQHVLMTSLHGNKTILKHCDSSIYPVYDDKNEEMFINDDCSKKWNYYESRHVKIKVDCDSYINVTENAVFDVSKLESDNCIFYFLDDDIEETYSKFAFCPTEKSHCDIGNKNFGLCRAYYAPTQGYKNYHCYLCDKTHSTKSFLPLDTYNVYSDRKKREKYENFMEFSLIPIVDQKEYRVKDIRIRFPIRKFIRFINAEHLYINQTASSITYEMCSAPHFRICCKCKPFCVKFRSCCVDYLWDEKNPLPLNKYLNIFYEETQKYKIHQCQKLIPRAKKSNWYEMVSDCMNGSDPQVRKKCLTTSEELKSFLPVVGEDLYLYRNMYCAQCNFQSSYVYVNISYLCNQTQLSTECMFGIEKTPANDKVVQNCNDPSCYQSECTYKKRPLSIFKNIHCSACNSEKPREENHSKCKTVVRFLKWSNFISFSEEAEIQGVSDRNTYEDEFGPEILVCDRSNIFSIFTLHDVKKKKYTCHSSKLRLKYGDNPDFDNCLLQRDYIHLFVLFHNTNNTNTSFINDTINLFVSLFNATKPNQTLYYKDKDILILRSNMLVNSHRLKTILSEIFQIQSGLAKNNASIFLTSIKKPLIDETNVYNFFQPFSNNKICHATEILNEQNLTFTKFCDVLQDNITLIDSSDISMNLYIDGYHLKRNIAACQQSYIMNNCTLEQLKKRIPFLYNGVARQLIDVDKSQSINNFYSLKDGICQESLGSKDPWFLTLMEAEVYISFIGSTISIIFYILTLISICLFPYLRNCHGKLTIVLVSSLLLGDGMFLFTGILEIFDFHSIFVLCKFVGILMHFGLLMAIIWNMVIAYDMMVTFTTRQINLKSSILKYLLIALLSTTFLIASALILDHLNIVAIGYGENGVCAPYKLYGRLYFYIIPTTISFIGSFIFVTKVVCTISSENRRWNEALRDSGRRDINVALIALKITLLLGLSEGIGFIQVVGLKLSGEESKVNATFGLFYTIFRSLRGLFVAIVYICKRENIQIFKRGHLRNNSSNELELSDRSSGKIKKKKGRKQKVLAD